MRRHLEVSVALAFTLSASPAQAVLGVASNAELLQRAPTVVIVKVTSAANGMLEGTVVESFRGPKPGAHLKIPFAALPGTAAEALVVCEDADFCGADRDRGGFFILDMPGRKAPTMLEPGVIERRALGPLTRGKPAPALCVHAKVHFLDEPAGDSVIEGKFSAGDGTGTTTGALLGKQPLPATLVVGGPTSRVASGVQIRINTGTGFLALAGAPVTRGADGCLTAAVLLDDPLARTPRRFAQALSGATSPVVVAKGTVTVTAAAAGIAKGTTAISLEAGGTIEPRGPLFADTVLCSLLDADASGGLRIGCQARVGNETTIWLDFGSGSPPLPGASSSAIVAGLVADGKPHPVKVSVDVKGKPRAALGTATIEHVAD